MLVKNNYPINFINKHVKRRIYKTNNITKQKELPTDTPKTYISLKYTPKLSESIANILKPLNINLAHKPYKNNNRFFTQTKQKINHFNKTHTIYRIDCKDCNGTYIGQSQQYLKKRLYAHEYSVKTKNAYATALAQHNLETGHNFDFTNVKILDTETNYRKRLFKEMFNIKKDKNAINYREDINSLSIVYNNLIS